MNKVDLLFPAFNRLAFTQEAWENLVQHTDWSLVNRLCVCSVGSTDGTLQFLRNAVTNFKGGCQIEFVAMPLTPIVEVQMLHIAKSKTAYVGKIDNDAMVSPRWLNIAHAVMERSPELSLFGLEAMLAVKDVPDAEYGYDRASFISGLFIGRREAFVGSRPYGHSKYYGYGKWQQEDIPDLIKGWIKPSLPFFLLDRMPLEPWITLSKIYEKLDWQRPSYLYLPECTLWEWKWPGGKSGKVYRSKADPTCITCRGGGRVQVKTYGSVFAYENCPKCMGLHKEAGKS